MDYAINPDIEAAGVTEGSADDMAGANKPTVIGNFDHIG